MREDAAFCGECGSPVERKKVICKECGAEIPDGMKFCGQCGTKVGQKAAKTPVKKPKTPVKKPVAVVDKEKEAKKHLNLGHGYNNKKDYDSAIAEYTEAINLNRNDAAVFNYRGNAYCRKKDYDRAIEDYTKAIKLNPKDAVFFNNRGNAYIEKHDKDRAIADYTEAIRLDPNNAKYKERFAFSLSEEDRYKEASKHYDLARKYRKNKDYDRAIAEYTEALVFDLASPNSFWLQERGDAYFKKGDYVKALADYESAMIRSPSISLEDRIKKLRRWYL
jgi:tetratricopeptide (TPR) repeat protein